MCVSGFGAGGAMGVCVWVTVFIVKGVVFGIVLLRRILIASRDYVITGYTAAACF